MKKVIGLILCAFVFCTVFVSCEPEVAVATTKYDSPTIVGKISIPDGTELTGDDFFVKVVCEGETVKVIKANADNSFVISGLQKDKTYDLLLTTEEPDYNSNRGNSHESKPGNGNGYGCWMNDIPASEESGNDVGTVKVQPLGVISGTVDLDGSEDDGGVTVYIPGSSFIAITADDGSFSISSVPQGTYSLKFMAAGYIKKTVDNIVLIAQDEQEEITASVSKVTLIKNVGIVEGYAELDGETDHSGILVKLEGPTGVYTASTSENGYYKITNVEPGTYTVLASYAAYPSLKSQPITVEAAATTSLGEKIVLMENVGSFSGSVSLTGGINTAGVVVSLVNASNSKSFVAVTNENGEFSKTVYPGNYQVTISYPGYVSQTVTAVVAQGTNTTITFTEMISSSGSISGKVVLEGSTTALAVQVTAVNSENDQIKGTANTESDGSFSITGLTKSGQYYLTFAKDGYLKKSGVSADVSLGVSKDIGEITLKSLTSKVKGKVTLEGTSDYAGINILLMNNQDSYPASTDQQGEYLINSVKPGEYKLVVSKAGYISKEQTGIVIPSSVEKELDDVALSIGVRSVTGKVILELRTDYSGALVTATKLSDPSKVYSAISNSLGNYTLAGMEPGEYQITITLYGYRTVTIPTVDIVANATKQVEDQNIQINRGTIQGNVILEGRTTHSGTTVKLMKGSEIAATTVSDGFGDYSFYEPQGNYSGVVFEKTDFASESSLASIALFADNYVTMENVIMQATHNTVSGTVDVLTAADDSNVTISFDNHPEISPFVTEADGAFLFSHIPVGEYAVRFKRTNCSDVIKSVAVIPSDEINLGTVELTPNSATVKGKVTLVDSPTLAGVTVSIDLGNKVLSCKTDSKGKYEIGGVSTAEVYEIKYAKEGWNTVINSLITSLTSLEERTLPDVELTDTTDPVILSLIINNNNNSTASRTVTVSLDASDTGSGVKQMKYTWTDELEAAEWHTYVSTFQTTIPEETNGDKTMKVVVRDYAGNESSPITDSIKLTDQRKTVSGTLVGDDLFWTKAKSPILISSNIVVDENTTLVIEPGVDVLFDGNYSITIRGKLLAQGTETEKIVFKNSYQSINNYEGYNGSWKGILGENTTLSIEKDGYKLTCTDGSIFYNCKISDLDSGIIGNVFIDSCEINSESNALGINRYDTGFTGSIVNSKVTGLVAFSASGELEKVYYVYGNQFININDKPLAYTWSELDNSFDFWIYDDVELVNNYFKNHILEPGYGLTKVLYCTFDECMVKQFGCKNVIDQFAFNCFVNSDSPIELRRSNNNMYFSNIMDNTGEYAVKVFSSYSEIKNFDWKYNFWGTAYTNQLNSPNYTGNAEFIYDGNDLNTLSRINISQYSNSAWGFAGYKGKDLVDYEASYIRQVVGYQEAKVGSDVAISIKMMTDGAVSKIRISQSLSELLNKEWSDLNDNTCLFKGTDVDSSLISEDGVLRIFVQAKDLNGNELAIKWVDLGYNIPYVSELSLKENQKITSDDSPKKITIKCRNSVCEVDKTALNYDIILDGTRIEGSSLGNGHTREYHLDDNSYFTNTFRSLKNGWHTFRVELSDMVGDTNVYEVHFEVEKPVPTVTEFEVLNSDLTLSNDEDFECNLSLVYATHLKEIRIVLDDSTVSTTPFDDNGSMYVSDRVLTISASDLSAGGHSVKLEIEDYLGNITTTDVIQITVGN